MTKEQCDRADGRANKEDEEVFLGLPPTTSLITEQLRSGMSEKAGFPDSRSENLGSSCDTSKRMYSVSALEFSEYVQTEWLNSCQSQFASMAEEETARLKNYAEVVDANGDQLMHRRFRKKSVRTWAFSQMFFTKGHRVF